MSIKDEQTFKFIKEVKKIFFQGGCGANDIKILMFLLENYDECFTQAEVVRKNLEYGWVPSSVSRSIKKLLALNLVEQIVINTTMKYKINLEWQYGYTYREELRGE